MYTSQHVTNPMLTWIYDMHACDIDWYLVVGNSICVSHWIKILLSYFGTVLLRLMWNQLFCILVQRNTRSGEETLRKETEKKKKLYIELNNKNEIDFFFLLIIFSLLFLSIFLLSYHLFQLKMGWVWDYGTVDSLKR